VTSTTAERGAGTLAGAGPAEPAQRWAMPLDRAVVAACLAGVALVVTGLLIPSSPDYRDAIALSAVLGAAMLIVIVLRFRASGSDPLDPLLVYTGVLLFYFVIHTVWLGLKSQYPYQFIVLPFEDALPKTELLIAAAFAALLVGYRLHGSRASRPPRKPVAARISDVPTWLLVLIFIAGLVFNLLALKAGAFDKSTESQFKTTGNVQVLQTLAYTGYLGFAVALCKLLLIPRGERPLTLKLAVWGFMLPTQVAFGFAVGAKMQAFFALFALILAFNKIVRPLRPRTILLAVLVFMFVVSPVIQSSRVDGLQSGAHVSTVGDLGTTLSGTPARLMKLVTDPATALTGFDIVNNRTNGSETVALAVKYTPSLGPYQYGRPWARIPLSLIPRFVWPNKPFSTQARDFSIVYGGESAARGYGLGLAPTIPGDLYLNFGIAGVLLGFVAIGWLLRYITRLIERHGHDPALGVVIYIVVMSQLMLVEQDVGLTGATLLPQVIVAAALVACLRRFAGRTGRDAAAQTSALPAASLAG
jgi:hypothetical protein